MTAPGAVGAGAPPQRSSWRVFGLLFVSVWINYIDRGILGVAAPALAPDLNLNPAQLGILLSSFFWTYSLLQPVGGWLVDRFDVYRVYAAGFAVWSLAVSAAGLAGGFATLLLCRAVLGAGESVAYPAYSRILATGFPEDRRGFANSMIDVGTKAGPALGTLAGGLLIAEWGWRAFFLALGAVSLIWLVPWLRWAPRDTTAHRASQPPGAVMQILRLRQAWATFLGLFFFNYSFYFLLTWLPSYLVMERQFSFRAMAVFGALPFAATAAASLFCGAFSDRLIRSGRDVSAVRKGFVLTGLLVCAVALPVAALVDPVPAMAALILAFTAIGLYTSNVWAISQTLAGPRAAGTWTGLQNAAGNMGGVVAPILTGVIVAATGSFVPAFLLCAAMLLGSALCYGLWIGRVAPVDWRS